MANETYSGRADFPKVNDQPAISPDVDAAPRPVVPGFGQMAADFQNLGQSLGAMQAHATQTQAREDAGQAVLDGKIAPQNPNTVYGASYNEVATQQLGTQRKAAMMASMGELYAKHANDPAALTGAFAEMQKGFGTTGFKTLDADLQGAFLTQSADFVTRAQLGLHQQNVEIANASFLQAVDNGNHLVDSAGSGASFDDQGYARVTTAIDNAVTSLLPFGPKQAFSLGGVDYPADPARLGMVNPEEMQRKVLDLRSAGKRTWILNAGLRLPDQAAKELFLDRLRAKYGAGDKMFGGLQGHEVDSLFSRLEADADRTANDQWRAQSRQGELARQQIEAFRWGGDVSPQAMVSAAQASGDPSLVAQASFYAQVAPELRGVLKTVVARQLGLIGPQDTTEWVDAAGHPVQPGTAGAVKPGAPAAAMADPEAALASILGGPVTITSGLRTPAHNAAVGGVSDSYHLTNHARDFTPPPGMTAAEAVAKIRQSGLPTVELLDEGDHVHVAWNGPTPGEAWTPPPGVAPGTPAFGAWMLAKEGFASDPIDFARGNQSHAAIASVPPLVPQGFAAAPDSPAHAGWQAALAERQAVGQMLTQRYAAPPRLLTNGEREFYKATVQADPAQAVMLATAALPALGESGTRSLLKEIGDDGADADAALHLADLHVQGKGAVVQSALAGLAATREGLKPPAFAHQPGDATQTFDRQQPPFAQAFGASPETFAALRRTAELAYLGDAARGIQHTPAYYLQAAAGGVSTPDGRSWGGVANWNGTPTPLPGWMNRDRVDAAMRALARNWQAQGRGPTFANGQVVAPHDLSRLRLSYRPGGLYALVTADTNQPLRGATGAPFLVNLDQARPFLARALPDAVMTGGR